MVSMPESGKMTSLPNWARSMNPDGKFQWKAVLKSGKENKLAYPYTAWSNSCPCYLCIDIILRSVYFPFHTLPKTERWLRG